MRNKRHQPEEIVSKLRQVEVLVGQEMARIDAIRQARITEQNYFRLLRPDGATGERKGWATRHTHFRCPSFRPPILLSENPSF